MLMLLALVACEPEPEGGCAPSSSPTLTLGSGEDGRYSDHTDGDVGLLEFGPQGGVHLTLGIETTGFAFSDTLFGEISATIGGVESASAFPFVFLRCDRESDSQKAWDLRLPFDGDPGALPGETATVTFALEDEDGRRASDSATFVLELD